MQLQELALLVQSMRNSQKEYFSTKSNGVLKDCKRLEKQVDEAVKEALSAAIPSPARRQQELFQPKTEDTSYEEVKNP